MNRPAHVPEGYTSIVPAMAIQNAAAAIEWYKEILGAREKMILKYPNGVVAHAELQFGDSLIMMGEEDPKYNTSPKTLGGNSMTLCLYVQDVDAVIERALARGAKLIMPAEDQFYGDRSGRIEDPFGYIWILSTHVKDVSPEEMQRLMDEMMSGAEQ